MSGDKKNVIYVGVFLSTQEREKLLNVIPARHNKMYADHITLIFRPSPQELETYLLGTEVEFEVVGEAFDKKGQAVLVRGIGLDYDNDFPHITISTGDDVKPVYSNELFHNLSYLLSGQHTPSDSGLCFRQLSLSLKLRGTIDTYPSQLGKLKEIQNG